jgi:hypothetical protein
MVAKAPFSMGLCVTGCRSLHCVPGGAVMMRLPGAGFMAGMFLGVTTLAIAGALLMQCNKE